MNVQTICKQPHGRPVQMVLSSHGDASEECFLKALWDTLNAKEEPRQLMITVQPSENSNFLLSWRKVDPHEFC